MLGIDYIPPSRVHHELEARTEQLRRELSDLERLRSQRLSLLKAPKHHWLDQVEQGSLHFHGSTLEVLVDKIDEIRRELNALTVEEDNVRTILDELERSEVSFRRVDDQISAMAAARKGPQAYYVEPSSYHGEIRMEHRRIVDDIAFYEARLKVILKRRETAERLFHEATALQQDMEESYRSGARLSALLESNASTDWNVTEAKLYVSVLEGKNLGQFFGRTGVDPYVVLSIGSNPVQSGRTRSFRGKSNPKFNDSFEFNVGASMRSLAVGVWHLRGSQQNEFLGGFSVTLSSLEDWREHDCWYDVPDSNDDSRGEQVLRVSEAGPLQGNSPQIRLRLKYVNPLRREELELQRQRIAAEELRRHQELANRSSPTPGIDHRSGMESMRGASGSPQTPGGANEEAIKRAELEMQVVALRKQLEAQEHETALLKEAYALREEIERARDLKNTLSGGDSAQGHSQVVTNEGPGPSRQDMRGARRFSARALEDVDRMGTASHYVPSLNETGTQRPQQPAPMALERSSDSLLAAGVLPSSSSPPPSKELPAAPANDDEGAGVGGSQARAEPEDEGHTDRTPATKSPTVPEVLPPTDTEEMPTGRNASKTLILDASTMRQQSSEVSVPQENDQPPPLDPNLPVQEQAYQTRLWYMRRGIITGDVSGGKIKRKVALKLVNDDTVLVMHTLRDNVPMPRTTLGPEVMRVFVSSIDKVQASHDSKTTVKASSGILSLFGLKSKKTDKASGVANLALGITLLLKTTKTPCNIVFSEREEYELWIHGLRGLVSRAVPPVQDTQRRMSAQRPQSMRQSYSQSRPQAARPTMTPQERRLQELRGESAGRAAGPTLTPQEQRLQELRGQTSASPSTPPSRGRARPPTAAQMARQRSAGGQAQPPGSSPQAQRQGSGARMTAAQMAAQAGSRSGSAKRSSKKPRPMNPRAAAGRSPYAGGSSSAHAVQGQPVG